MRMRQRELCQAKIVSIMDLGSSIMEFVLYCFHAVGSAQNETDDDTPI
jgi:hypothetical protein